MKELEYCQTVAGIPLLLGWRLSPELRLSFIRINPERSGKSCCVSMLPAFAAAQAEQLCSLVSGEISMMPLDGFDLDQLTPFRRRILLTLHGQVARGRLVSYGGLASLAGCLNAARAVGGALNANPFPVVIPCHRVVAADHTVGGFGPGIDWKLKLLVQENVRVGGNGFFSANYFC